MQRSPKLLLLSSLLLGLFHTVLSQGSRQYTIANNCPSTITVLIGGAADTTLAHGASVTKTLGVDAGFFYTSANNGNADGGATKAGFYGDNDSFYYYIVKDTTHFNTGISITPNHPPDSRGFCPVARCDDVGCTTAFTQPPTRFSPPSVVPPPVPVYSCPGFNDLSYTITFCPSGSFPSAPVTGQVINPNGNPNKCLDVRGASYANGTPVQIYDCNGTGAQKWLINRGSTKIQVANTNFCLDAGSNPASGVGMKIWQCYDNLAAQQWHYNTPGDGDNRNHVLLGTTGQCLDLTNGDLTNSNRVQTWACTPGNPNQVWVI